MLVATALLALLVVPLAIALVALHDPRWYPSLELAQTEIHVRDVGTAHTPLTGLIGRLGAAGERGSHPGPLGFYALAPIYRLAGSSPWALQVATVVLHLSAVGTALWIGHRRGGARLLALTAAFLAVLLRFYGASVLTEPWNPFLPMLWWVVFVLAVWSVLEDDLPLLPLAAISGSLCAQTHVAYVGLIGGLGAGAVATVLVHGARRQRDVPRAQRPWAWLAISAAIGAVLSVPPVLDELKGGRGNLSVLVDYFTAPTAPIGLRRGIELLLANLDPWRLLLGHADAKVVTEPPSWSVGSLLFLAAWIASIVVARRLRQRSILRLDAALGFALVFGALSASRIYGLSWAWLLQWAWGLTALTAVAITWTGACVAQRLLGGTPRMRRVRLGAFSALAVVALGSSIGLASDAAHVEPNDAPSSSALRRLVPATVDALDGAGRGGRYLITWTDPVGVSGALQAFGLANELDRAGIDVGFEAANRLRAAPHLTMDASQATAVFRLVTGSAIADWEEMPGARRVVLYDPRTGEERAVQARLRREIDAELRELGLAEMIVGIDRSFVGTMIQLEADERVPRPLIAKMGRALELGIPSAVFLEASRT